jgi:hypothetical protein
VLITSHGVAPSAAPPCAMARRVDVAVRHQADELLAVTDRHDAGVGPWQVSPCAGRRCS